jgi:hypothetical protein
VKIILKKRKTKNKAHTRTLLFLRKKKKLRKKYTWPARPAVPRDPLSLSLSCYDARAPHVRCFFISQFQPSSVVLVRRTSSAAILHRLTSSAPLRLRRTPPYRKTATTCVPPLPLSLPSPLRSRLLLLHYTHRGVRYSSLLVLHSIH